MDEFEAYVYPVQDRSLFAGKITLQMIQDFYANMLYEYHIDLNEKNGLSEQDQACVDNQLFKATIHEFGDLRGKSVKQLQSSIGPEIVGMPRAGNAVAVYCHQSIEPIMVGVLIVQDGL